MIWYYLVICNFSILATALAFGFNAVSSYHNRVADAYNQSSRKFNEASRAYLDGRAGDGADIGCEAIRLKSHADKLEEDSPVVIRRRMAVSMSIGVAVSVAVSIVLWNLQ